jgi:hypothetical protein
MLAHLAADAALAGLMGGAVRIYDEPPRAAAAVYAVFGEAEARDWSTGSDRGHEHVAALVVWAKEGSAKSALAAAERIADLLDGAAPALDGHRLVLMRAAAIEADRDARTNLARATVRITALTEVA